MGGANFGYNKGSGFGFGSDPGALYYPESNSNTVAENSVNSISNSLQTYEIVARTAAAYMDNLTLKTLSNIPGVWLPGMEIVWNGYYGSGRIRGGVPEWWGGQSNAQGQGGSSNFLSELWNSTIVRAKTGDALFVNTTSSLVFLGEGSNSTGLILPLRGPDAFKLNFINTASFRLGAQGGWDVSAGKTWFNGPVESAYVREMNGYGASLDVNLGVVLGWGPGAGVFESHNDEGKTTWFGAYGSFGYGIGGSLGFDYTYTTPVFGK